MARAIRSIETPPTCDTPVQDVMFRIMTEHVEDVAIFMVDTAGCITTWNAGVEGVLGYAETDFVGRTVTELFTPEDRLAGRPEQEIATATASGRASDTGWMMRKDGTRFWALGSLTSLWNDDVLLGFVKVMTDLTEKKAVEDALRDKQARLRTALEAAQMGTWRWEFGVNRQILDAGMKALFGLSPGAPIVSLEDMLEHVHPEDRDGVLETFHQTARNGGGFDIEFRAVWPDQTVRWLKDIGRYVTGPGESPYLTGAAVDMTEHRLTEEHLRQVHRLEAVRRLAGGVAHEINNMM
jgi:PAS domain S-box-containing protein